MVQLILFNLKVKLTEVKNFDSKDKLENFLEKDCCPNYVSNPAKGIKYRVQGATWDKKSEESIVKPYLFKKKDASEED